MTDMSEQVLAAAIDQVLARREAARQPGPWTADEMLRLARGAVSKIDRLGLRGVTTCSMDEIAAMAGLLVASGALNPNPNEEPSNVRAPDAV